eukprot:CAMPEP_0201668104 /NCGR_PEP_ID=MMETSP0494-20130426/18005_1 /ASSEMBLY_ACC=CAM_ASM_000839 /TAXON_ID=420259 /ORGANISM="Thalassiosira gravida, Strain GMp14c1" /LENGTH=132 /DNA_ID=CAMNT_0048148335 /DNA_START=71 /DNA_END=470 /DNA_ORIENTATION=-
MTVPLGCGSGYKPQQTTPAVVALRARLRHSRAANARIPAGACSKGLGDELPGDPVLVRPAVPVVWDALSPIQGLGLLHVIAGGLLNIFEKSMEESGPLQSADCKSSVCEISRGSTPTTTSPTNREENTTLAA